MMRFRTTNFQFCGVLAQMRSASCHKNAVFSEKFHLTQPPTVKNCVRPGLKTPFLPSAIQASV